MQGENFKNFWNVNILEVVILFSMLLGAVLWFTTDHYKVNDLAEWRTTFLGEHARVIEVENEIQVSLAKLTQIEIDLSQRLSYIEEEERIRREGDPPRKRQ